jgi:formylglycine-generating enzyme required for sulfatase activity
MIPVSTPRHSRVFGATLATLLVVACGQESRDEASFQPSPRAADAPQPTITPATVEPAATGSAAAEAEPVPAAVEVETDEVPEADLMPETLADQRAAMLRRMRALHGLEDSEVAALEAILGRSKHMGQGNPDVVRHPMTRAECVAKRREAGARDEKKPRCGSPYMVPLYDPATETEADARVCIDRYEFPGLPCEYPVTWVTTAQAQNMCKAIGKRLCDAHEWEGGCAGALHDPEDEYAFKVDRDGMRGRHNLKREIRWAYGTEKDHGKCATSSTKSKTCESSGWKKCGSNTYPAGSFPECRSPFGVYDQHGNVAEHMSLPLKPEELGSRGGFGVPEMKGSWFIFSKYEAHIDDCRWRSPSWHDNEGRSHSNYHLGFRCCKDVE